MTWQNRERIVALSAILIGLLGVSGGFSAGVSSSDPTVGPGFVPAVVGILIVVLGFLLLLAPSFGLSYDPQVSDDEPVSSASTASRAARIGSSIFAGGIYLHLIGLVGYFTATLAVLPVMLFVFHNRGIFRIASISIIGSFAYYLIFIRIVGLYDPKDWLRDMTSWLPI